MCVSMYCNVLTERLQQYRRLAEMRVGPEASPWAWYWVILCVTIHAADGADNNHGDQKNSDHAR